MGADSYRGHGKIDAIYTDDPEGTLNNLKRIILPSDLCR